MVAAMTQKIAYGQCWTCPEWFWYGVLTVPSVAVDQAGRAVEDDGGTVVYRLAPICPRCVGEINRERADNQLPLFPADTAQIPAGHLGPLDLPGIAVSRPEWFVPTNGLPMPAHVIDCFDPSCPGCFSGAIRDAITEAVDGVIADRSPYVDDEDTLYESSLCPMAGLPASVQAVPVRTAPESAVTLDQAGAVIERTTAGLDHVLVGGGHAAYCWCRPGEAPRVPRCACGRSNPHVTTEVCG